MHPAMRFLSASVITTLALLQGCTLPSLDDRTVSVRLRGHRREQARAVDRSPRPGESGAVRRLSIVSGRDAFAARVRLADVAERSLDVQYYIWHDDRPARCCFEQLRSAADRGVRVRLLLDDNNTNGLDELLATLEAQPNVEVRLYNPFVQPRGAPAWTHDFDYATVNRRMHNKSFTADNQAAVIGGRNVGDEYFGGGQDVLFVDLDVLAVGPIVDNVSQDFDRYWASGSSYLLATYFRQRLPPPLPS